MHQNVIPKRSENAQTMAHAQPQGASALRPPQKIWISFLGVQILVSPWQPTIKGGEGLPFASKQKSSAPRPDQRAKKGGALCLGELEKRKNKKKGARNHVLPFLTKESSRPAAPSAPSAPSAPPELFRAQTRKATSCFQPNGGVSLVGTSVFPF